MCKFIGADGIPVYPKSPIKASRNGRNRGVQVGRGDTGVCKWVGGYRGVQLDRGEYRWTSQNDANRMTTGSWCRHLCGKAVLIRVLICDLSGLEKCQGSLNK